MKIFAGRVGSEQLKKSQESVLTVCLSTECFELIALYEKKKNQALKAKILKQ